jgi:hypothetical protein
MTAMTVSTATKTATQTNTGDALPAACPARNTQGADVRARQSERPESVRLLPFGLCCERVSAPRHTSPHRMVRCGAGIGCRLDGVRV